MPMLSSTRTLRSARVSRQLRPARAHSATWPPCSALPWPGTGARYPGRRWRARLAGCGPSGPGRPAAAASLRAARVRAARYRGRRVHPRSRQRRPGGAATPPPRASAPGRGCAGRPRAGDRLPGRAAGGQRGQPECLVRRPEAGRCRGRRPSAGPRAERAGRRPDAARSASASRCAASTMPLIVTSQLLECGSGEVVAAEHGQASSRRSGCPRRAPRPRPARRQRSCPPRSAPGSAPARSAWAAARQAALIPADGHQLGARPPLAVDVARRRAVLRADRGQ